MSVNLRKIYYGKENISKRNRPYKYQLDYYHNGKRIRETIKLVVFFPNDTKQQRKEKDRVINKIKNDLEIDLANQSTGLITRQLQKANFVEYFKKISETKSPNTKTAWDNTLLHIIEFHGRKLKFEDVTENWIERFTTYLLSNLSQNSARTYLQKISTALNMAVKQKIILENPYKYISKPKKEEKEMVFLTENEVQEIINTSFFDNDVKNSFLFGCYTGLRFIDIKSLKWDNIKNNRIQITQKKTKGAVYIPLNKNAEKILDLQKNKTDFIFNLSRHNSSVNRTLRKLIKKTNIDKDVSFHSSRHTFATLLVTAGVNIYTVSKLLGHRDIESTLVYAKVVNEEKEKAVNSIPNFNF